ncbi:hypothetical protein K438DRAFT_1871307 [Mycena galopus ATCC 62051]|nr:hypothetical protein K438DRAFT_1871307 [Mycena galopus ATCC 62051]
MLPKIETVSADHNALHDLSLSMGPCLTTLDASHNEITQLTLVRGPVGRSPLALTSLDISNAKLSLLDDYTLSQLTFLRRLMLDCNSFRSIPESLGDLKWLETLSCADNSLSELPKSIGRLQKLETLDVHNNSLTELPISLWNCASLSRLNVTSNLLVVWHDPPPAIPEEDMPSFDDTPVIAGEPTFPNNRKPSTSTISDIPPLAHSLELLYLGENSFTAEVLHSLMILKELRVLNLSFNNIQDMPSNFFRHLTKLEEVYLSGNGLTNFPSEDLPKLTRLSTLFLNENRLQTLPQELGKVRSLTVLDVGSNSLKYNINNWEFDWNWNFNKSLRYLNLSGNKRLQIKSDVSAPGRRQSMSAVSREFLAGFSELTQLRVLGLMDVTITTTGTNTGDIPDENDDRRVRTSSSVVNGMSYGIADTLGKNEHLNMLDLVHEFRGMKKDAVFAMFGRAQPPKQLPAATTSNRLAKYLQENFVRVFLSQINSLDREHGENVPDALRRSFLKLNQDLHDTLFSSTRKMSQTSGAIPANIDLSNLRSGASGIVVYILDKKMYVANVGNVLAVVSRGGSAVSVSRKHDPYDRAETARIRATEGWISPPGLVKDEIDISRSFGFFHLIPTVNARPDIFTYDLTELDEFVIIANRGLWDYVSYQTAVDIAQRTEPMVAAQKLRDFAISYGADGSIMTMVIGVADLFKGVPAPDKRKKRGIGIMDRTLDRLKEEVPPPVGHVAIVLTSIKGLMHLRDVNPALPTAMHLHNTLLRRFLRICGGYEVKTEDDSFMCSFPTALAAVWWCMTVQVELLDVPWPLEILECADGKAIYDEEERLIARGLSVRMGIHCGTPICERDRVTNRMDYFGPIVNQTSRIEGSATGGHIMCSSNVIREINAKIFETEPETEYSDAQPQEAIDAIRRLDPIVVPVGEVRLEGLEVPELLSLVFPSKLIGRKELDDTFGVVQMRELAMLCLRLEMSAFGHVPYPEWNGNRQGPAEVSSRFQPPLMTDKMTDADLMSVLHSLTERIENVEISLRAMAGVKKDQGPNADSVPEAKQVLVAALMSHLHPQPQSPLAASAKSLPRNKSLYSPKSLCIRLAPAFLLLSWVPPETLGSSALDQFTVESFENYITQSIIPNLESREFWAASNLKNWLYARGEDHYNMICGEHFLTHVLRRVQSMHIVLPPMLLSKNSLTDIYCLLLQCPDACPIHSGALRFLDFLDQYHADLEALVTLLKCKWWTKIHPDARRSLSAKVCKYMAHDISVMVAELVLCLQDREFLGSPGARAQNFLDLLQDVLDLDIFSAVKPLITKALLHLCSASGLYPRCFTLTSLEKVGEQVAAGGFSDIWKGLIRTQTVCVKVMRLFQTADIEALLKEFGREALIWRQLCHPNLLPFLGIYYLDKRLCLVSPWMETGNVMEFLKNEPPNTIHRLSLILDVALGLDHLRTQNVVHGDLKAINILVTPSRRACIADFGLAHIASTMTLRFTHSTSNVRGGTTRYLAPELFKPSPSHFGSDVYAFASTCYEIMTGKVTFHELPNDGAVMFAILRGEHPSRPQPWSGTPALDGLWDLLQTCWYSQPEERPSARQIVQRLEELSISATAASSTTDWDEKFTSKFRRGLRDKPLVPLATQLEEMLFGGGEV